MYNILGSKEKEKKLSENGDKDVKKHSWQLYNTHISKVNFKINYLIR